MHIVRVNILQEDAHLLCGESRAAAVCSLLKQALDSGLKPVGFPSDAPVQSFTISMPPGMRERLNQMAQETNRSLPQLVCGLVHGLALSSRKSDQDVSRSVGSDVVVPDRSDLRAQLRDLLRAPFDNALRYMAQGKVVLLEASTGIGKGRFIAAVAIAAARAGQRVVIAAPLAVSYQIVQEITTMGSDCTLLLGRPNFIDANAAMKVWSEMPPALRAWIDAGGPPQKESTQRLAQLLGRQLAWLAEDAMELINGSDLSVGDVLLRPDSDCPAQEIYKSLRQGAHNSPIVICSHIMLAANARLLRLQQEPDDELAEAGMMLPHYDVLIVDEAHMLEQAFSTVHSATLHLHAAIRHAKKWSGQLQRALEQIHGYVLDKDGQIINVDDALGRILRSALEACRNLLRNKRVEADPQLQNIQRALTQASIPGNRIAVSLTPVKHYPVITAGRGSVSVSVGETINRARAALMLSATMFTPTTTGWSDRYIGMLLGIKAERRVPLGPVIAPWLKGSTRVIYLPTEAQPDSESVEWHKQVAHIVQGVYKEARGGVLVLMTSYESAQIVGSLLRERIEGEGLIVQTPNAPAAVCAGQFRSLCGQGKRALWLGVGAAWTGIDLSASHLPAEEDFWLTDLVIPRLPWRTTKSITHQVRVQRMPQLEGVEVLRTFRQGLGRLIRREGLKDRRIVLCDPRLVEPKNKMFVKAVTETFGAVL